GDRAARMRAEPPRDLVARVDVEEGRHVLLSPRPQDHPLSTQEFHPRRILRAGRTDRVGERIRGRGGRAATPDRSHDVTSARSMAMLSPELKLFFVPVLTIVSVCEPELSTALVHTTPEALRDEA